MLAQIGAGGFGQAVLVELVCHLRHFSGAGNTCQCFRPVLWTLGFGLGALGRKMNDMTAPTIYACATAPGRAALAVVRVSGPDCQAVLAGFGATCPPPRLAGLRRLVHPHSQDLLDEALILYFSGPHSYTGEDVVELHLHGGAAVVASVLEALSALPNCRPAEAGEFTRRAVLHGKLDLTRAEAVADLIDAETTAQQVQALGQLPVDLSELGATAVTISGHKVGGPFGIGALIVDPYEGLVAVSHGGGQERDIRSGTFDAPAAAAFAVAVHHAVEEQAAHAAHLRSLQIQLAEGIASVVPDAIINGPVVGDPATRLPGNVHASFPGAEGDALLMLLDAAGVDCSTGSACTAGVPEPSHVLLAMGVDERTARSSLRFSFGRTSTDEDVAAIIRALPGAVERARRAGSVSTDRYRAARENEVDR